MRTQLNKIILAAILGFALVFTFSSCSGDDGDGYSEKGNDITKYRTVEIGEQMWMAENLDYKYGNSWCYEDKETNCEKYGRLYDWETAKKVCPSGWHLPTNADWDKLFLYVDSDYGIEEINVSFTAGKDLKATSGWNNYEGKSGNGMDKYDFSALPGGARKSDGSFHNIGSDGDWWSASDDGAIGVYYRGMSRDYEGTFCYTDTKSVGYSVRCVEN
jgi:uncharacterized protein (TIGR02145 family)